MEPIERYTVSAKCPYCGAHAWSIQQDSRNLEEWHYCSQCKATGSIIAMAAEKLEMTEVETIRYLIDQLDQELPHSAIQSYCRAQDLLQRYRKFWEHARLRIHQPTPDQRAYLQRLGWHPRSSMSRERLEEGPGRLFGLADPRYAKKQLKKPFRVKEPLVVVPFYGQPDQINGFSCLTPSQEILINSPNTKGGSLLSEFGFAGFQLLDQMHSEIVVATSMLQNMMQLHMRHFSSNKNPLPLIGWKPPSLTARQKQWSILDGRKIVIWEREPTAVILHQAIMCNADLTFVGPTVKRKTSEIKGVRWKAWISHDPAIDVWRRIVRSSRPYEHALRNWARQATSNQKVKLLQDAERYDEHTALLVRSVLNPKLAVQVGRTVRVGTHMHRPKGMGNQTTIIERDGKWYNRSGKVRFPGILRVTHVVARPSGEKDYVGYLKIDEHVIQFQVPMAKANMRWLKNHAIENGEFLQEDKYINVFRNHKLQKFDPFEAAIRFELPEVVNGVDRVGWDGSGFQFKGAHLLQGVFRQNPEFKLPVDAPGPTQQFCRMREEVMTALNRTGTEMEITWAMAIALCAQVTAPAVGLHPYGIWIHRKGYDPFLQALFNRFGIFKGPYSGWKHRWPRRLDKWRVAVVRDDSGFFVTRFDDPPKIPELLVIRATGTQLQPRGVTHSADKIVLNYLKHFTTLQPEFPGSWENWVQFTVEQFQQVFDFVKTKEFKQAPQRVEVV